MFNVVSWNYEYFDSNKTYNTKHEEKRSIKERTYISYAIYITIEYFTI